MTQQSSGCGESGDQIMTGYQNIVDDENIAEQFAEEWKKYRFGVFDINGFENDSIYPPCGVKDARKYQICDDAFNVEPSLAEHNRVVGDGHNRYLPSKQNFVCDRQDPIDIIMRHADFNDTQRNQMMTAPTFHYVRKTLTRYMIVIDDHPDLAIRDSYQFLRDAFKKFIEKDLNHAMTEVGVLLMGNSTISDEDEQKQIKPLTGRDSREEIFAMLPWYIEGRGKGTKCTMRSAVLKAVELLDNRSKMYGDADSNILIIAPGMFSCSDDVTSNIINSAKDASIKISTINYPNIGPNRIDMDHLAYATGGGAFTIIEKKQNEQMSLLTTYFELTTTLVHISGLHASDQMLPVEIYRKELIDSGSREENRATFDSFNVDEATDNINFFVYIYDRKERNIEKGMKLISPNNQEFSTVVELRAEYHQLAIVGNMTGKITLINYFAITHHLNFSRLRLRLVDILLEAIFWKSSASRKSSNPLCYIIRNDDQ